MTTTIGINQTNYDAFSEGGALPEQQVESIGFRRLQHFNENTTYHRDTTIERGGYGIDDKDGDAPDIGKSETIKHRGGGSTIMRVAKEVEIALIGISPRRIVYEGIDPTTQKWRSETIPAFIPKAEWLPGWKCRSQASFFVALRVDDARALYETTFSGYITDDAVRLANMVKGYSAQVAQTIAKAKSVTVTPRPFMLWLPLGVGESRMAGKEKQSPVTPPVWKLEKDEDLMKRCVSGDDFRKFLKLYEELLAYLATSERHGGTQRQQIAAPQNAPALAALAALAAPIVQLDPAISANGDVTV